MNVQDFLPPVDSPLSPFFKRYGTRPKATAPRKLSLHNLREDAQYVKDGVLDLRSFVSGYLPQYNPAEVVVRDKNGKIKAIRRQHNLRVTQGRDNWQRLVMFGDIAANCNFTGVTGAATASSATSLTNSGAAFPTSGGLNGSLQGHIVVAISSGSAVAYGVIVSNTATVLTIDKWHTFGSATDATATTPTATTPYVILPGGGPVNWIGLSTNATAPAAGDVPRTADGLYADGTTGGTASEQNASGLTRQFIQPTFPSASNTQFQNTWTYTGSSAVTIAKVVMMNAIAAAGNLLFLETLLSAPAAVNQSGDTIAVTWTPTL